MRSLLILFFVFFAFGPAAIAQTTTQPSARVITSRAAAEKHLGKAMADQIPLSFNFKLYALAWSGIRANKDARLEIHTLLADQPTSFSYYSGLSFMITRTTTELRFVAWSDALCSGGRKPQPGDLEACLKNMKASYDAAQRTLPLFATPRHKLKKASIEYKQRPPRP